MAEETIRLPIHSALIPLFYQDFHCLAQDCQDTCCGGWDILFGKKDYLHLRRLDASPALRKRLDRGVRRVGKGANNQLYGKFDTTLNNGCCTLLDEDGLCALHRAYGPEALIRICADYPRKNYYTFAAKEYVLSPACEGVLQLLWDRPEGVDFVEDPLPKAERRSMVVPGDESLLLYFAPVRGAFVDILQNRTMSLTERMLLLGLIIQRLQKADWKNFDLDEWEQQTSLLIESNAIAKMNIPGNQSMFLMQNLSVLSVIAALNKSWTSEIYQALEAEWNLAPDPAERDSTLNAIPNSFSKNAYVEALAQFKATFSDYEYFFENLMVATALYMIFPHLRSKEDLWKSYVSLCILYSFYRFVSVLGCKDEPTKKRLFHMIVMANRDTLHNKVHLDRFQEELFRNESFSLAHMAVLLRWD